MTIEASQFINQLNPSFPRSTDLLKEGDDHIRMIKASLQRTFPNFTGSIKWPSNDLNNLFDMTTISTSGISFNKTVSFASGTTINAGSNRLQGVGTPLVATDAVNLDYLMRGFLNKIYPVGSIYMSTTGQNPTAIFGGTWESVAGGRYLIGAGDNGMGWSVGPTGIGGTTSFTLDVNHIPAHGHLIPEHGHGAWSDDSGTHSHGIKGATAVGSGSGLLIGKNEINTGGSNMIYNDGNHSHTIHVANQGAFWTQNTGGNQAVGYTPAWYCVNVWRRTALA